MWQGLVGGLDRKWVHTSLSSCTQGFLECEDFWYDNMMTAELCTTLECTCLRNVLFAASHTLMLNVVSAVVGTPALYV